VLVVDASVAVKWFYPEQDTDKAMALLRTGQKLIAPEIIRIEVAAALTRLLRMGQLQTERAVMLLEQWRKALTKQTVSLEPTEGDFAEAVALSIHLQHQLQDCLYVAVAQRLGAPLVTADRKLLEKSGEIGCAVQPLKGD
jgi:predicted nucleic acid-binding protein